MNYEERLSGLLIPVKFMEKAEFDRILKDEGIRSARARDNFWKDAQRRQPLTEKTLRLAVRKVLKRAPDLKWRTF
jgi:hypothetical protein